MGSLLSLPTFLRHQSLLPLRSLLLMRLFMLLLAPQPRYTLLLLSMVLLRLPLRLVLLPLQLQQQPTQQNRLVLPQTSCNNTQLCFPQEVEAQQHQQQ